MSLNAYSKTLRTTEAPRQTEYRLFAQITGDLMRIKDDPHMPAAQKADALDRNRRLWMVLAADCRESSNQLPDQLKARIISISIWVIKHTNSVIRDGDAVDDLIEVNRTIMQGLASNSAPAAAASRPAVPVTGA